MTWHFLSELSCNVAVFGANLICIWCRFKNIGFLRKIGICIPKRECGKITQCMEFDLKAVLEKSHQSCWWNTWLKFADCQLWYWSLYLHYVQYVLQQKPDSMLSMNQTQTASKAWNLTKKIHLQRKCDELKHLLRWLCKKWRWNNEQRRLGIGEASFMQITDSACFS